MSKSGLYTHLCSKQELQLAAFQGSFVDLLRGFTATAIKRSELGPDEDPGLLAFELNGIILAADTNFVLHDGPAVLDLARQAVRRRLGRLR